MLRVYGQLKQRYFSRHPGGKQEKQPVTHCCILKYIAHVRRINSPLTLRHLFFVCLRFKGLTTFVHQFHKTNNKQPRTKNSRLDK